MKRLAILGVILVILVLATYASGKALNTASRPASSVVTLSERNTLVIDDVVTAESMSKLEQKLMTMSASLSSTDEINLVLYTPGGDVVAGELFIDMLKAVPQRINTVTIFAASMGFHIVQNATGTRYILPSGVLMSHRARGQIEGEFNGSINTRLQRINEDLQSLEERTASRMGLALEPYRILIRDEYWAGSWRAIRDHAADHIVAPRCDATLAGTVTKDVVTLFGTVTVVMSKCPLVTSPLEIKFPKTSDASTKLLVEYFNSYYSTPSDFVQEYIESGKWQNVVK